MFTSQDLSMISTPVLQVGYFDVGPRDAPVVLLLHGWPDDPRTWRQVAEALVQSGRRVVAPYLRGFGPTRFRDHRRRTGDLVCLGADVLQLADALKLENFAIIGHDWGARAAYIAACAEPRRATHLVALSVGWGTNSPDQKLSLVQAHNYWYHWLFALDRGEQFVRSERRALTRYITDLWAVAARMSDERFDELCESFDNPDWADVVLHSYRVRWGLAEQDADCIQMSDKIASNPVIRVPTLVIHGGSDPCNDPATSEKREELFSGYYAREVISGAGHFPQWETPEQCSNHILEFLGRSFE